MRLSRLRRRTFCWATLGIWIVFFAVREMLAIERLPLVATAWAALALAMLGAISVARLHDRGRSGWWLGAIAVPVAGALWLAFELALARGSAHDNAWGADPRDHRT
jgi:uncharacterized membrane protein YhaH (DUF805 family)